LRRIVIKIKKCVTFCLILFTSNDFICKKIIFYMDGTQFDQFRLLQKIINNLK